MKHACNKVSHSRISGEASHGPRIDLARPNVGPRLPKALKTVASFNAFCDTSVTWSFGLDLTDTTGGEVLETNLTKLIPDLTEAAEKGVGVAILIDEAHGLIRTG